MDDTFTVSVSWRRNTTTWHDSPKGGYIRIHLALERLDGISIMNLVWTYI
jgi:hypothetical protein